MGTLGPPGSVRLTAKRGLGEERQVVVGGKESVAELAIAALAAGEHPLGDGDGFIYIVIDQQFAFAREVTVEAADVLLQGAAPGDGEGEEEGVERGFIKSFAEETACCKENFSAEDCPEVFQTGAAMAEAKPLSALPPPLQVPDATAPPASAEPQLRPPCSADSLTHL